MSAPSQIPVPTSAAEQAKPGDEKLSPAELKKRAKAEKQARRAAQKEQAGGGSAGPPQANGAPPGARHIPSGGSGAGAKPKADKQQQQKGGQKHGSEPSASQSSLPVRRRPSQSGGSKEPVVKKENKQVELFSHLYSQPRRRTVEGVPKEVHPAVLALGFQMSSYEICGSSARCVAMLLAFKAAIDRYTTPSGTSLARHLTSHYLSPQIDFLKSCRPISESMGNAIRWLKKLIVEIDPSTPEPEAKSYLYERIDSFILERITVTDEAIANSATKLITNGAVVLTYAKSAIVEKTILRAHASGTKFTVIVVDSRPLFEGKKLATSLALAGLNVKYYPFSGLARAVANATIVFLGAHSMLSNGRLQSRIGTAPLAMAAHKADIPVIVCCESVKFSGKVALDSIVLNEVAPPEELLLPPPSAAESSSVAAPAGDDSDDEKVKTLSDWKEIKNLQILNLMYDVTPAEYIRMVICEFGSVPPSSVPVVHRLANEAI